MWLKVFTLQKRPTEKCVVTVTDMSGEFPLVNPVYVFQPHVLFTGTLRVYQYDTLLYKYDILTGAR